MTIPYRTLGGLLLLVALGQTAAAQSGGQPPPQTDISGEGADLSQKLNDTAGVIHPRDGVDPGMQKEPPATGTMPVVPPPGTAGNRSDVVPK